MRLDCFECHESVEGVDLAGLGDAFIAHARAEHSWPHTDQGIRNYAEATQRLTGPADRLAIIGEVVIHPVTDDRIDDWLRLFDHDVFVGKPEWAACYCLEPHVHRPGATPPDASWQENRAEMTTRLGGGRAFGYLAYVDDVPAGWVNASRRSDYTLFSDVDDGGFEPSAVVGVSCFAVAPPYRDHGLAGALLDRVIEDAADRGAEWVEAYPFNKGSAPQINFRGPTSMYLERGFEPVEVRERDTVMRRKVG